MEKKVSLGLKIWLWFIIVTNGISVISDVTSLGDSLVSSLISIVVSGLLIYACVMIMFQMKKMGFKLMCIIYIVNAVISVVLSLIVGVAAGAVAGSAGAGLAGGLIGAVIVIIAAAIYPLVTYLLMKKDWDMFE